MADIKYYWYFLSIRPRIGFYNLPEENQQKFINWLKWISSSYKIVLEKENDENHLHALLCLENKRTTKQIKDTLVYHLKQDLNLDKKQISVSSNIGGAIVVVDDLEQKLHYISGNYQDNNKDKKNEYYKCLCEKIEENDKKKIIPFFCPDKKIVLNKYEKFFEYICDNYTFEINKPDILEKYLNECIGNGTISGFTSKYQKEEFLAISYMKLSGNYNNLSWKNILQYNKLIQ